MELLSVDKIEDNSIFFMQKNRRNLLKFLSSSTIAFVADGAADSTFGLTAKPANIRWAQGYLLWRNFKPQSPTLQDALNDLNAIGSDGIEFSPLGNELERNSFTKEAFKQLIAKKKLAISGNYFSAPFYDVTKHAEILQEAEIRFSLLQEYGAKNMIIGPASPKGQVDRTALIKQQSLFLNELGKRATARGIQIGIHPHLNTLVETPAEIDLSMETTDPHHVFLSPDTGHIHLAGGDVLAILEKYQNRLNYFHFKDCVQPFVRPNFAPNLRELGRGEIDFPSIMRLLKKLRFKGWINIEQDATLLSPKESSRISMEYVRHTLATIYR